MKSIIHTKADAAQRKVPGTRRQRSEFESSLTLHALAG